MPAPRVAPHIARPACPVAGHTGGYVWLDGTYTTNEAHARTRYKCAPRAAQQGAWKKHPFYVPLPHREPRASLALLDRACDDCEHVLTRSEGPVTPHRFIYSAREAATILREVAFGGTYREISQAVRQHARRETTDADGRRATSAHGSLATDYLDLFGDVVYEHFAPATWPEIVAMDALPFRVRDWEDGVAVRGGRPVGSILGAFGYPEAGEPGRVWHVAVSGGLDQFSWEAFLRSLPQDPAHPVRYVVCDDDTAIQAAVAAVWPRAVVYVSEEAIQRGGLAAIPARAALGGRRAEVLKAVKQATWNRDNWRELEELARLLPPEADRLRLWIAAKQPLMARQWAARRFRHPRSAGALEEFFAVLKVVIGVRRYRFRNASRLERLVKMVVLRHRRENDPRVYARLIRRHLEANGGGHQVAFRARDRTDRRGEESSLKRLETEALARRAAALGFTIPAGTTPKAARQQLKDARTRFNAATRLAALSPDEQEAVKEANRTRQRGYAQARRAREDAERVAAGLSAKRRRPRKPVSPAPPIPEWLDEPDLGF